MGYYAYDGLTAKLLRDGLYIAPRGKKTVEIIDKTIEMDAGTYPWRDGMSRKLAYTEGLMLLGGFFDIDLIKAVAPNANHALFEKQSDYGRRVRSLVPLVIDELRTDRFSRRAVIQFNADMHFGSDNIACTMAAQFLIRDDVLLAHFFMRSWDIVFGMPNDLVMFGMLTKGIARCLPEIRNSMVTVTAGSFHMYEETSALATAQRGNVIFNMDDSWPEEWNDMRAHAKNLAQSHDLWKHVPPGIYEARGAQFNVYE